MAILNQAIAIPIWAVFMAIAAIVVLAILIRGLEAKRQIAAGIGIVALLTAFSAVITSSQWAATGGSGQHTAAAIPVGPEAERRALEARQADLAARAATPGSPLACLDALAGVSVDSGCEQAVFASPISAAVAVSYAAARLQLLADSVAFARRADPSYASKIGGLRLAVQNDAYGIYAHILAERDGCTPERCDAFALLGDPSTLKVHLRQHVYASYVAQYRDRWRASSTAEAVPRSTVPTPTAAAAATMALAGSDLALSSAAAPVPVPRSRPTPTVAGSDDSAAVPTASITPPPSDANAVTSAVPPRSRGPVPPVASVLPNLDFPSSSSIPPISIMAPEPKLPPADAASAKPSAPPSTTPQESSRPQ